MSPSRTFRPRLESLEGRCLPSTFTVTNLKDDGSAGCLRSKIAVANLNPGGDTIVFKPGLEGTIRLNSTGMAITDHLTLLGPGAARVALDAHSSSLIFDVNGPGTLNVKIQGLELRNGRGEDGGAIDSAEKLTLVGVVLTGNRGYVGGAVFAQGNLTLRRCTITGNTAATKGGAVYCSGATLTVVQSTISGNLAGTENLTGSPGGGLFASGTVNDLIIVDSTISGNWTLGQGSKGGGLYSLAARTTLTNTKISYNHAYSAGGGLAATGGATRLDRCTISGNTSQEDRGGGIRQSAGFLTLINSTVRGNHADESQGGGLYVSNTSAAWEIRGSTVSGNSAAEGGGLFSVNSALRIDRTVIKGNSASSEDVTPSGGGLVLLLGSLTMTGSTVSGNTALVGGGIRLENTTAESTIRGSIISANLAGFGAGLWVASCPNWVMIQNSTISGNRALGGSGGGIATSGNSLLSIQNSTIAFNEAGSGGGIAANGANVNLESTIVANNRAPDGPDLRSVNPGDQFFATYSLIGSTAGANFVDTGLCLFGDPLLAPLAFNGGKTQTHALKKGSLAINKGSNSIGLTRDQRGGSFLRNVRGVDIGAFERQ